MQGVSRLALEALRDRLAQREVGHGSAELVEQESRELFAVAGLLGREVQLRTTLTDPSTEGEAKAQVARAVLGSRISEPSVEIVAEAVRSRWSRQADLADALELLGAEAAFARSESAGTLDRVEDELFRFARVVASDPGLRHTLSDTSLPVEARTGLVRTLLGERADATTLALLEQVVGSLRGRRVEDSLDELVELAATRRSETVAEVTSAVALSPEQESRLTAVLARVYGTSVRLQVQVDPDVLGGIVVRVGDEVVDGSVVHRIEQARRAFAR